MLEVAWTLWIEIDKLWMFKHTCHSTLAASTQIVLFFKMLKFSKNIFFKQKLCVKENNIFKYSNMFNMKYSKLINYLTNLCRSCPCTRICKIVIDSEWDQNTKYYGLKALIAGNGRQMTWLDIRLISNMYSIVMDLILVCTCPILVWLCFQSSVKE
jgi:hypothetical protein